MDASEAKHEQHPRPTATVVSTGRTDAAFTITVSGDIDLATVDQLAAAAGEALADAAGAGPIELDLRGCEFIDSTGLGAVLALNRKAGEAGRSLRIRQGGRSVRRSFEISRLTGELPFVED